jgi:hypothetical protein
VNNYQGKDYSQFRIATDATNQTGGKQELAYFVSAPVAGLTNVATPEPAAMILFGSGLAALVYRRRFTERRPAAASNC